MFCAKLRHRLTERHLNAVSAPLQVREVGRVRVDEQVPALHELERTALNVVPSIGEDAETDNTVLLHHPFAQAYPVVMPPLLAHELADDRFVFRFATRHCPVGVAVGNARALGQDVGRKLIADADRDIGGNVSAFRLIPFVGLIAVPGGRREGGVTELRGGMAIVACKLLAEGFTHFDAGVEFGFGEVWHSR